MLGVLMCGVQSQNLTKFVFSEVIYYNIKSVGYTKYHKHTLESRDNGTKVSEETWVFFL